MGIQQSFSLFFLFFVFFFPQNKEKMITLDQKKEKKWEERKKKVSRIKQETNKRLTRDKKSPQSFFWNSFLKSGVETFFIFSSMGCF